MMFNSEDFNLPLEKQLRLRVIDQEIDECTDYDALKDQLKQCTTLVMKYQHLLSITLQDKIQRDFIDFISKIEAEIKQNE